MRQLSKRDPNYSQPESAHDEAVRFLKWLRPGGPWLLTAIIPDGTTRTRTITRAAALRSFLAEHDGERNIYYSLNPSKEALHKKATKDDIAAAEFTHADVDPKGDETPEQCKKRALKMIKNFGMKPSAVIDSGNGLQLIWRLDEPAPVDGRDGPATLAVEAVNRALEQYFGGDNCHNVDRILRLPGTINIPNKKKRKKGRVECTSSLVWANGEIYSFSDFPAAEPAAGAKGKVKVEIPEGALPKVDLGELALDDDLKKVIREGCYERWGGDRSAALFYVLCALIRARVDDNDIIAIQLDARFEIGQHVRDKGAGAAAYVVRQLERALAKQPRDTISLDDFVSYLPESNYVYLRTRAYWPRRSVNARLPWIKVGEKKTARRS